MAVNFGGIASGLDTQAIIDATIAAQRQPINRLQERRASYETQISDLGKVKSALTELSSLMEDMQETSNVLAFDATSSDEDVLNASIDGAASAGVYDITVNNLAVAEKDRSGAFDSEFSAVKEGTLTLTAAGDDPVEVTIEDGDTLRDVVSKINSSGAGVDASLLSDGTHTYVQLVSKESGFVLGGTADDAITISESYSGSEGGELGFTQVVQARNASVDIDGLAVESRSNTLTDVISDVTVHLTAEGSSQLSIAADRDGTKEQVTQFVDKYNDVLDQIRGQTRNADGSRSSSADPSLARLESELRGLIGGSVSGATGTYDALTQVGVGTNSSGKLELDSSALDAAMDKDIRAIGDLFTIEDTGVAAKFINLVDSYTDSTDGVFERRESALQKRIDDTDDQVGRLEQRLDKLTTTLKKKFTALELTMTNIQMQSSALMAVIPGFGG